MSGKHIGILTGGGDVPGLNSAIKSVYQAVKDRGWLRKGSGDANVTGIRRGWRGALHMGSDPAKAEASEVMPLTDALLRTVDRSGGRPEGKPRSRFRTLVFMAIPSLVLIGIFMLGFIGAPEDSIWLNRSTIWGTGDPFYKDADERFVAHPTLIWRGRPNHRGR